MLSLEPLSAPQAEALLEQLRGDIDLGEAIRERIAAAAEGNPLFVEQMVATVLDQGGNVEGTVRVPPSIQALLAERLDRLTTGERAVIERAAVAGKEFLRGEIVDLSPPELRPHVGQHLMGLVRRELIRPCTSPVATEDGFQFRHVLIRDAAYDGLPKEVRAELHERFAARVEALEVVRGAEFEEIVGYHLEQAFRYRDQLGRLDESGRELAARGAMRLASAGRRAFARGDMPAAAGLLTRATILLRDDEPRRLELAPDLGEALIADGRFVQAEGVLSRTVEAAAARGDARLEAHALVHRAHLRLETDPEGADKAVEETERALSVFSGLGDDRGLARGWHILGTVQSRRLKLAAAEEILRRALAHADRADAQRERASILIALGHALYLGPVRVDEAIPRCESILESAGGDLSLEGATAALLGGLHAMRGSFDNGRELCKRGQTILEELGTTVWHAFSRVYTASVELLAGNAAAAERELLSTYSTLDQLAMGGELAHVAALLSKAVYRQGRVEEAGRYARVSEETASSDDAFTQIMWRTVTANVLAQTGDRVGADRLSQVAVAMADETDSLNVRADALVDRADVLGLMGEETERRHSLERAVELYDAKGNVACTSATRAVLRTVTEGTVARGRA
jgi:tetratricopeptide (TPR) repeat protein